MMHIRFHGGGVGEIKKKMNGDVLIVSIYYILTFPKTELMRNIDIHGDLFSLIN